MGGCGAQAEFQVCNTKGSGSGRWQWVHTTAGLSVPNHRLEVAKNWTCSVSQGLQCMLIGLGIILNTTPTHKNLNRHGDLCLLLAPKGQDLRITVRSRLARAT